MDLEFSEILPEAHLIERLQPLLPAGINLLECREVPVSGPSLSQRITAAVWSFDLFLAGQNSRDVAPVDWLAAVGAVVASESLIWHDTDKKGRPRQRDCRPSLQVLECLGLQEEGRIRLRLKAEVDAMGRSIRPTQIQHWLTEHLQCSIGMDRLCRDGLLLSQC